jgi:hypothetical protein
MTKLSAGRFARLTKIAKQIDITGHLLAYSLGIFRGTNDFAGLKTELMNGFVLDHMQQDAIAMVLVRADALLAGDRDSTDANLPLVMELVGDEAVQVEVMTAARVGYRRRSFRQGQLRGSPQGDDRFPCDDAKVRCRRDQASPTPRLDHRSLDDEAASRDPVRGGMVDS